MTEEQQNCPYCHGELSLLNMNEGMVYIETKARYKDKMTLVLRMLGQASDDETVLNIASQVVGINYCPMCGRGLNEVIQ